MCILQNHHVCVLQVHHVCVLVDHLERFCVYPGRSSSSCMQDLQGCADTLIGDETIGLKGISGGQKVGGVGWVEGASCVVLCGLQTHHRTVLADQCKCSQLQ